MYVELSVDGSVYPSNPGFSGIGYCLSAAGVNRVGWAAGPVCTGYIAEIAALQFGLESSGLGPMDYGVVYSDSLVLVNILTSDHVMGVKEGRSLAYIRQFLAGLPGLRLQHVCGHTGHPGNEAADFHAGQIAKRGYSRSDLPLFVPAWRSRGRFLETRIVPLLGKMEDRDSAFVCALHDRLRTLNKSPRAMDMARLEELLRRYGGDRAVVA